MTELKTWKDFHCTCRKEDDYCPVVSIKDEAIKWIKYLTKKGILFDLSSHHINNENQARKAQIKWIKKFFNITDEDLK